jgi:hypothetical protein
MSRLLEYLVAYHQVSGVLLEEKLGRLMDVMDKM